MCANSIILTKSSLKLRIKSNDFLNIYCELGKVIFYYIFYFLVSSFSSFELLYNFITIIIHSLELFTSALADGFSLETE